jgi:phosphoserine phosphatase
MSSLQESQALNLKLEIIVFDMDGVLVDTDSSWQFVHRKLNTDNSNNLKQFLSREIRYLEFMRKDIELWGRVSIGTLESILDEVPLMKGAKSTVAQLKRAGFKTAVVSSGISILAERVQRELEIDSVFANKVLADTSGFLTGKGVEVVNPLNKKAVLRKLAHDERTTPSRCAVIGDTIFDVPMFGEAGLSIAFNTNDKRVRKEANVAVEGKDLKKILPHLVF